MSTLKATNVQAGQSATASNNFVLRSPDDGTLRISRGNSGATISDALTIDSTNQLLLAGNSTSPLGAVTKQQLESFASGTPLLFPIWCPSRSAIPAGFAAADGQTVSRTVYPAAWSMVNAGTVPVVAEATWQSTNTERGKFTTGDGSTTFRLPDYNGKSAGSAGALVMRGDGAKSAGVAGAIQLDALQNITGSTGSAVQFRSGVPPLTGAFFDGGAGPAGNDSSGSDASRIIQFDASRVVRTATETRPLNVTGCWIIRLAGTTVNSGNVDTLALSNEVLDIKSKTSQISVEGNAPAYSCRAWVNFNGTGSVAIRESGNVSSITDNGVGDYTVNFTVPLPDDNYAAAGAGTTGVVTTLGSQGTFGLQGTPSASSCRITYTSHGNTSNSFLDFAYSTAMFFR